MHSIRHSIHIQTGSGRVGREAQHVVRQRSSLVLLQRDVVPTAASRWRDLGLELIGDECVKELDTIGI